MADYIPFNPNANDAFGFTDPSGATPSSQPGWRWILVGGILVLVFVYCYQNRRIDELKKMVIRVKSDKKES